MTWLLSFLSGPLLANILKAYQAKLAAGNTTQQIDATLAARELAVQEREIEAATQYKVALIGRWYEPVNLLGYIIVAYVAKVVVWDTMLDLGSTAAVRGSVGEWMGMVMLFLVGKRGLENVARIIRK